MEGSQMDHQQAISAILKSMYENAATVSKIYGPDHVITRIACVMNLRYKVIKEMLDECILSNEEKEKSEMKQKILICLDEMKSSYKNFLELWKQYDELQKTR